MGWGVGEENQNKQNNIPLREALQFKLFCFVCFCNRVCYLHAYGCPGTSYVDQAGFKSRDSPAFISTCGGIKGKCHNTLALGFVDGLCFPI